MERWLAKVLAIIGVFILPFVCTILPIKVYDIFVRKGKLGEKILSWLMCFGGGVFFATYMLHMGPEVRRILQTALVEPYHVQYPIADLFMAAGFFLVLFIEKIALAAHMSHQKSESKLIIGLNGDAIREHKANDDTHNEAAVKLNPNNIEGHTMTSGHGHSHAEMDMFAQNSRSVVLALALSLHRIFEGMSVGLKHTVLGVGNLFLAVMCHETVIGFSLGLQFVRNKFSSKKTLVCAILCSIVMPIGVAIGTIIVEMGNSGSSIDIVNGVLQAISTGTFIYVTFFEILHDQITHSDTSIGKVVWISIGFIVMAALCAIPEPAEVLYSLDGLTTVSPNVTDTVT